MAFLLFSSQNQEAQEKQQTWTTYSVVCTRGICLWGGFDGTRTFVLDDDFWSQWFEVFPIWEKKRNWLKGSIVQECINRFKLAQLEVINHEFRVGQGGSEA